MDLPGFEALPMRATHFFRGLALALLPWFLVLQSCGVMGSLRISGRLTSDFGCYVVRDRGKNFEVSFGRHPVPPLGSDVTLLVQEVGGASTCMVGPMVEVVEVVRVRTDFRTAPVTSDGIWGPSSAPIVLGRVEVKPGVTLTILPGTVVHIIPEGELRVRGKLIALGAPGDSVHFVGRSTEPYGGAVIFDSADTTSQLSYCTANGVVVYGAGPSITHLRAGGVTVGGVTVGGGQLTVSQSALRWVTGWYGSEVTLSAVQVGSVDGVGASFSIEGSTLRDLSLSYSRASVTDSRFDGPRSYILFHGESGGTLERNVFLADSTTIALRHTSDPEFHDNDFDGRAMSVVCETYQRAECVRMEQNWWGSPDEDRVRARITADCPVCYAPWRTTPALPSGP